MYAYIIRRLLYSLPVLVGIYLVTFLLFNVRDPMTIARVNLPQAPRPALEAWIAKNNFHLPRFVNLPSDAKDKRPDGKVHPEFAEKSVFYSQFFLGLSSLFSFDFGKDKNDKPIGESMLERIGPSLSIMVPAFFLTVAGSIIIALLSAYFRGEPLDQGIVFICVLLMSVALPVYLLAANYLFGRVLKLAPVYNHVLLPILVAIFAGVGGQIRFYRSVFLEQVHQDYVRSARARGVPEAVILFRHILRNSLIPILTSVVMSLPFLITGSLLLEQFFGIPGMGDFLYWAIIRQDFQVVKVMVFLGSLLYMLGSLMTDISYTLADPRVAFE